ncbi:unnamed protein product, partial [Mesorhabditis spiculigera]
MSQPRFPPSRSLLSTSTTSTRSASPRDGPKDGADVSRKRKNDAEWTNSAGASDSHSFKHERTFQPELEESLAKRKYPTAGKRVYNELDGVVRNDLPDEEKAKSEVERFGKIDVFDQDHEQLIELLKDVALVDQSLDKSLARKLDIMRKTALPLMASLTPSLAVTPSTQAMTPRPPPAMGPASLATPPAMGPASLAVPPPAMTRPPPIPFSIDPKVDRTQGFPTRRGNRRLDGFGIGPESEVSARLLQATSTNTERNGGQRATSDAFCNKCVKRGAHLVFSAWAWVHPAMIAWPISLPITTVCYAADATVPPELEFHTPDSLKRRRMDELLLSQNLRRAPNGSGDHPPSKRHVDLKEKPGIPYMVLPKEPRFKDLVHPRFALDIGGTLCKLIYTTVCHEKGSDRPETLLNFTKFTNLDDCIKFVKEEWIGRKAEDTLRCTGGGAFKYSEKIHQELGVNVHRVDEMEALIEGCDFLLNNNEDESFTYDNTAVGIEKFQYKPITSEMVFPFLLVNIGTGISILKVNSRSSYERIGGSSMGGGTFVGLGNMLTGAGFDELLQMASRGDHRNVDTLVADIYGGSYDALRLSSDVIAGSFGKCNQHVHSSGASPVNRDDIAKSLLLMVSNNIGQMAMLYGNRYNVKRIYFGGFFVRKHEITMRTLTYAVDFWSKGACEAFFMKHEGYLGAVGAFFLAKNFVPQQATRFRHTINQTSGLLRKNKFLIQPFIRTCFHPGAGTQAPIQSAANVSGWEVVKRLLRFVWPKGNAPIRKRVVIAMGLLIIAKLANVAVPFLYKDIVNYYNDKSPEFMKLRFDTSAHAVLTVGMCIIVAYGLARASSALMNELRNAVFARVAQHATRKIAHDIFLHLHSLDLSFHLNRQTGALSKAIDRGTRGMAFVMSALIFNVFPTIVELGMVSAIFATTLGSEFAYATMGCVGMYGVATLGITRWRTKFRHEMNQADNDAGNKAVDSLINYETVKYFNNEKFEAARYDHFLQKYQEASLKTTTSLAFLNFTQNAIFSTGLVGIMALAANGIQNGTLTVGDLVLANTLLFQLSIPLNFLGSVYREIRQGLVDMNTMFGLLNLKSKIVDDPNAKNLDITKEAIAMSFKDVHFEYIPGQHILQGLNLDIPEGKKVAVVGGSGSGKSTIVRLIYRLYDVDSGQITIENESLKKVSLTSLRDQISIVPQDCVLFHDTIYYNLAYGNPEASREEVINAAKMADLHESVLRMPNGYETLVGERGLKLSGGEKQRVAIARAILKNAPLVVYDEATSSLDAITESNIMSALRSAVKQRTTLFIAHRLATIVDADIIYVLKDGRVAEQGTHQQLLLNPDSLYSELWKSQNRGVDAEVKKIKKVEDELEVNPLLILEDPKCCGNSSCSSK